jgi:uncharacterized protein YbgA (DUF1722 family)
MREGEAQKIRLGVAELADVIPDYRGLVPLVMRLTRIEHHVRRLWVAYLAGQTYLSPHPKELMLKKPRL